MAGVVHIELYRTITYVKDDSLDPFAVEPVKEADAEMLFVFAPDAPDVGGGGGKYFARLLEAGFELFDGEIHDEIALERGKYYFIQERAFLKKDAIVNMARAIENFARNEKHKLVNKLYLRYVYEDGSAVTQLFWPTAALE
jgi:hypothetical protein